MKKSEMKITGAAGVVAGLPIILEMLQGQSGSMSENMMLALIACATAMVVAYNVARGMAKEEVSNGAGAPSVGGKSTEFKLSAGVGGLGAMPVLIDMLRGGEMLSEKVKIALMVSITLVAMSYSISRGMAKTEKRPPVPPPTAG